MHDGYDKIPTWLDLVVNKKIILQNFGAIGKAGAVSCKRSYEDGRYFVAAVIHVQPAGNCRWVQVGEENMHVMVHTKY